MSSWTKRRGRGPGLQREGMHFPEDVKEFMFDKKMFAETFKNNETEKTLIKETLVRSSVSIIHSSYYNIVIYGDSDRSLQRVGPLFIYFLLLLFCKRVLSNKYFIIVSCISYQSMNRKRKKNGKQNSIWIKNIHVPKYIIQKERRQL